MSARDEGANERNNDASALSSPVNHVCQLGKCLALLSRGGNVTRAGLQMGSLRSACVKKCRLADGTAEVLGLIQLVSPGLANRPDRATV